MNKLTPIKPIGSAFETLPSFTDAAHTICMIANSIPMKRPRALKLNTSKINDIQFKELLNELNGKQAYLFYFDDSGFKDLNKGLNMIKSPQDVDWE